MNMNKKLRRLFSVLLAVMMIATVVPANLVLHSVPAEAATTNQYGLMDDVQDGVILHCWDWSFNNIKAQMETIAKSGYSAIQTSPIQEAKEPTKGVGNKNWWVFYQPKSFTIDNSGQSGLGTKAEFEAMCEEAHKYGIKVIVDIVANHTGNGGANGIANTVIDDLKNDRNAYHNYGNFKDINYGDRYSITHDSMGLLPDLNTESSKVQGYVYGLLKECIDAGADGFRFDAAKHIGLPSEGDSFWTNTLVKVREYAKSQGRYFYAYGEILDGTGGPAISEYTNLMSITENQSSNDIRGAVAGHNASAAASSYYKKGASADKLVMWAESHDTYSNDSRESTNVSTSDINKTWALVATRNKATALYFVRTQGWRAGNIGDICTNDWKSKEVVEVNKFHNYFNGQSEYLASEGSIAYNERGTTGAVLVNCNGTTQQVSVTAHKLAAGTYKDQVSGNTFTVSNGKINGQIGSTGIAVVYNAEPIVLDPVATISKEGGEFSTDTLTLSLGLQNATSGTYQIDTQAAKTFTSATSITIGSGMSYGESVTITLTATDGKKTFNKSYTFTKVEKSANIAMLKLPSGWGTDVYCYAYDSATEKVNNGTWPGAKMTLNSATGYYEYEIPDTIKAPRVIFYNSDSNRYPADMQPGLLFEEDGSWLYADGKWSKQVVVPANGTVVVKYLDEAGAEVAASTTTTGKVGASYTTSAKSVSGYTLKTTPANANGTYAASTITVTYVYAKVVSTDPTVVSSLANGSSFTTETAVTTLTLENAVKGTYSVDNGPVKEFTGPTKVTLGRGKVGDSTVTLKATAVSSTGAEKSYTFTYNKEFEVQSSVESVITYNASSALGGKYATNPNDQKGGAGVTITSPSDFKESMIIAQGVANDDPRIFRGSHEAPVYDTYSLYGAWDDTNLYLGWQFTNVTDVVDPAQGYPISDNGKPWNGDIPQMLAFDLGQGKAADMTNGNMAGGAYVWGLKVGFETNVDALMCFSSKPGVGQPALFKLDSAGYFNYDKLTSFKDGGISFKYEDGFFGSSIIGIKSNGYSGYKPSDLTSDSSAWVNFLSEGHNKSQDTFYYMTIPLATLGVTRNYIETNGIGVMHISTFGEGGIASLPMDMTMLDNATEPYSADESTSAEKEDTDIITVPLARIGAGQSQGGGGHVVTPTIPLQVNFGADRSAPQSANTTLKLSATGYGGKAPYTYEFKVDGTTVKANNSTTTANWTATAGEHTLTCIIKDADGNTATVNKGYTVEGTVSTLTGTLTVNGSTGNVTAAVGSTVTFKMSATGGSGSYQYKIVLNNLATGTTSVIKNYDSVATKTAKLNTAGVKEYVLYVKDSTGKEVKGNTVRLTGTSSSVTGTLTVNGSTGNVTAAVGSTVTFRMSATGGSGSYQYKIVLNNLATGATSVIKNYDSVATKTAKLSTAGVKEYVLYVKDSTGKEVKGNTVRLTGTSSAFTGTLTVNGSTGNVTAAVGSTVTFKMSAAGGSGSYQYKIVLNNITAGTTSVIKNYDSVATKTAKLSTAGVKEYVLYVKDSTGKEVKGNTVRLTGTSSAELTGTLTVNGSTGSVTASVGSTVTFKMSAAGGSGSYQYKVILNNLATGKTSVIRDYSSTNNFTAKLSTSGTKLYILCVKDSTGKEIVANVVTLTGK